MWRRHCCSRSLHCNFRRNPKSATAEFSIEISNETQNHIFELMITDNTVEQTNLYFQQNLVGKVLIDLSKYVESKAFNENDILSCISSLCLLFYTTWTTLITKYLKHKFSKKSFPKIKLCLFRNIYESLISLSLVTVIITHPNSSKYLSILSNVGYNYWCLDHIFLVMRHHIYRTGDWVETIYSNQTCSFLCKDICLCYKCYNTVKPGYVYNSVSHLEDDSMINLPCY